MKYKTTAKALRNSGDTCLAIGYCDAQYLLRYHAPVAYTCGVYGWNFDVFCVHGVTICTGYRGMVGKSVDYAVLRSYEEQARRICEDWNLPHDEKEERVEALLREFIEKVA